MIYRVFFFFKVILFVMIVMRDVIDWLQFKLLKYCDDFYIVLYKDYVKKCNIINVFFIQEFFVFC